MSTRLSAGRPDCRTTDHSVEIARMRRMAEDIKATYPDHTTPSRVEYLHVRILECAAALLEVHDATGISLDRWDGPRKLVQDGLLIIGAATDDFLPNGV